MTVSHIARLFVAMSCCRFVLSVAEIRLFVCSTIPHTSLCAVDCLVEPVSVLLLKFSRTLCLPNVVQTDAAQRV